MANYTKTFSIALYGTMFIIFLVFGYCANFYKFVKCDFEAPYKCELMHGTGVFIAPVGIVLGYLNLGE